MSYFRISKSFFFPSMNMEKKEPAPAMVAGMTVSTSNLSPARQRWLEHLQGTPGPRPFQEGNLQQWWTDIRSLLDTHRHPNLILSSCHTCPLSQHELWVTPQRKMTQKPHCTPTFLCSLAHGHFLALHQAMFVLRGPLPCFLVNQDLCNLGWTVAGKGPGHLLALTSFG